MSPGFFSPPLRLHPALPPDACPRGPGRPALGPRDQARRVPLHRPPWPRPGPGVHPARFRLDRPGAGDRRGHALAPGSVGDDRWRGGGLCPERGDRLRPAPLGPGRGLAGSLPVRDGRDLRQNSWEDRRGQLGRVLRKGRRGIHISEHIEGGYGSAIFEAACENGLAEGPPQPVLRPHSGVLKAAWKGPGRGCDRADFRQTGSAGPARHKVIRKQNKGFPP